ncbi:hypothetical protein ACIBEH_06170 [Nocardia salmonicida]|uniref:hypothetical protein n=1 Tax=Nocardia salmonicida TaxID=53431 RepID=UPI0037B21FA7
MTDVFAVVMPDLPVLDVVFLHGLGGQARTTWADGEAFWPAWLGEDIEGAAVWTVGYAASPSGWLGKAMPIQDRAVNVLARLQNEGVGERPLVFVTHSMGGLLAKQMLLHAQSSPEYAAFAAAARGVAFLSTPHTGADMASFLARLKTVLRTTVAGRDLKRNSAQLRDLNIRYRNWVHSSGIENLVFFEAYETWGIQVVDAASADPGLVGAGPISVDADHFTICKLTGRSSLVYGQVRRFIAGLREKPPPVPDLSLPPPVPESRQPKRKSKDVATRTTKKASGNWPTPPRGAGYRFAPFARLAPRPGSYQLAPSYLLDARYEVVPFRGRGEGQVLENWLDSPVPRTSVQLVHGEGGQGKTRLAMQVARRAAEHGWHVAQAFERSGPNARRKDHATAQQLLVVVDYAERWRLEVLEQMVLDLVDNADVACLRVLLLARAGYGLGDLITATLDRTVEHIAVPVHLGRFTADSVGLATAFVEAVAAFQSEMQLPPTELTAPPMRDGNGSSPLGLHMAALATVLAHEDHHPVPAEVGLSEFLLAHERRYWSAGSADLPAVTAAAQLEQMSRTVLIATLFGPVDNSAQARHLLRAAHLVDTDTEAQTLLDRHAHLYPAQHEAAAPRHRSTASNLRPLHPDYFAEDFVAWCVRRPVDRGLVVDLVRDVTSHGPAELADRVLGFLATTAARHHQVNALLDEFLDTSGAYVHVNAQGVPYYLHRTTVHLRDGQPQTIYFFAKVRKNAKGVPTALPADRFVRENPRNGFLTISKSKDDPPDEAGMAAAV